MTDSPCKVHGIKRCTICLPKSRAGRPAQTYIAGPMTNIPAFNYPEFAYVAASLRSRGVEVVNPAELHGDDDTPGDKPYTEYLRIGLEALLTCDAIVMLQGWEHSRGARLERYVADALGMKISEWAGSSE